MNIWEIDKTFLFLVLILPGFVSLKVYSWLIASESRDYSKSFVEAICYSVLNFTFLSWILFFITKDGFITSHPFYYWLSIFVVFLIAPASWPFLFLWISTFEIFKKNILSPYKQPWDYVFSKRESFWVAIHLKNGEVLRGKYALNSFASSYPSERQLYIEELWISDEERKFGRKANRTRGILVSQDEISYIKFYGK